MTYLPEIGSLDGTFICGCSGAASFETGVLAAGFGALKAGAVLGFVSKSTDANFRKLVPHDHTATNGAQEACCVLLRASDATSADVSVKVLGNTATVFPDRLVWNTNATADSIAAGLATLAQRKIIVPPKV